MGHFGAAMSTLLPSNALGLQGVGAWLLCTVQLGNFLIRGEGRGQGKAAKLWLLGGSEVSAFFEANPTLSLSRRMAVQASRWMTCLTSSLRVEVREPALYSP